MFYTLGKVYIPNIMILCQTDLQIFLQNDQDLQCVRNEKFEIGT